MKPFDLPLFLNGTVAPKTYACWLQRKARTHVKRDRGRGNAAASVSEYKQAIHDAVCNSNGKDVYTNETLKWSQIGTYDNAESARGRRVYKAKYALLPTIDHVGDGTGPPNFVICAWRTNDAKGDLSLREFVALCERVLAADKALAKGIYPL